MKKFLAGSLILVFAAVFVFSTIWSFINFDIVTQSLSGTQLYVKADINAAYEDGYNTALSNADEYEELIQSYRTELSNKEDSIASLTDQVTVLTNQVTVLETDNQAQTLTIANLNGTIENLNEIILNLETEKQQLIDYYENLLTEVDLANFAVVTFMVYEEVFEVKAAFLNSTIDMTQEPTSTTYAVFEGWSIDTINVIDLNTYTFTEDVTLTALFTYYYDVNFMVDGAEYDVTQLIEEGQTAAVPALPTKEYYNFLGWSLDGVNIADLTSYVISQTTTFEAVFEFVGVEPTEVSFNETTLTLLQSGSSVYDGVAEDFNIIRDPSGDIVVDFVIEQPILTDHNITLSFDYLIQIDTDLVTTDNSDITTINSSTTLNLSLEDYTANRTVSSSIWYPIYQGLMATYNQENQQLTLSLSFDSDQLYNWYPNWEAYAFTIDQGTVNLTYS